MKTNFLSLLFHPMEISFSCLWSYGHENEGTIFCSWKERNVFLYWCSWFIPKLWMISLPVSQCFYHWHHMVTGKIKWKKMFSFSYWSNHVVLIKSSTSIEWEGLCCLVCQTSYSSHTFICGCIKEAVQKQTWVLKKGWGDWNQGASIS